ncbi:MAG TPA: DUF11 domain-containing protein [Thermogutta sp.]|nr:DUF11 domain-containing protein [Thermogutta sp.]
MIDAPENRYGHAVLPPTVRVFLICVCTLILCSCRTASRIPEGSLSQAPLPPAPPQAVDHGIPTSAFPVPGVNQPGFAGGTTPILVDAMGNPLPRGLPPGALLTAWNPPGISPPWPQDELLADGGDLPPFAGVQSESLGGINPEDTVAQFTSEDGRTQVQPFNRVFIYSPRFASVRQVINVRQDEQAEKLSGFSAPTQLSQAAEVQPVGTGTQNYQPVAGVQQRGIAQFRTRQYDGAVSQALGPRGFAEDFKPYENFSLIVKGIVETDEMPLLANAIQAAIVWSSDQNLHVFIDGERAAEDAAVSRIHSIYRVTSRYGQVNLRLVKVASKASAQPGETVDLTLRFDNVGTVPITQLVIVDSLSTRLEYVPDSSQSSIPAKLTVQPNEAGSSTLQWELENPLPPGEGGIIRFSCRIR